MASLTWDMPRGVKRARDAGVCLVVCCVMRLYVCARRGCCVAVVQRAATTRWLALETLWL